MDSLQKNKHLLHRLCFGPGPNSIDWQRQMETSELIDYLLAASPESLRDRPTDEPSEAPRKSFLFMDPSEKEEARTSDLEFLRSERNDWIYRMASDRASSFIERMTLFWHGHFACQCKTSAVARSYIATLQRHALGNFRAMLHAVAKEPAMIRFLNNQQNRKDRPNENFARELMELFTLGPGHYTEQDIQEAARAFTGWSSDLSGRYVFRRVIHDFGVKDFMGKRGRLRGEDIIDIILSQRQTASFVADKMYRHFVHEQSNADHVSELAQVLFDSNYDIAQTMRYMLHSPWFFDPRNIGTRIKSPIELIVHVIKLLRIRFDDAKALSFLQRGLGQLLLDPPNVAGWPGGRSWINNATLMLRLNLSVFLHERRRFDHASATPLKAMNASQAMQYLQISSDPEPLLHHFSGVAHQHLEEEVKSTLLAVKDSPAIRTGRDQRSYDYPLRLILRTLSMPEFQMC